MKRRILLGAAGWVAVAATATAGTVAAIGVLEDGITGSAVRPLDGDDVQRALSRPGAEPQSQATAVPTSPTATPAPGRSGTVTRVLAAGGGTVTARCAAGKVTLVAWSPAQGYRADDLAPGPAATASLSFTSDAAEYVVTVHCGAAGPVARASKDDGHHGRGRGGHDG
jgi:hypothetical protein